MLEVATQPPLSRIKSIVGGSAGNLVEWYDWYAYSVLTIYFAPVFFPKEDPTAQLHAPRQDRKLPAVLSREFGIPAVIGTSIATKRIATGDRIRVDGSTGVVEVLETAAAGAAAAPEAAPIGS